MSTPLWTPSAERMAGANMTRFIEVINQRFGQQIQTYSELHQWSIQHLADFWDAVFAFTEIKTSTAYSSVIDDPAKMPGAQWFTGARMNFAENLLRFRDDRPALVFRGEDRAPERLSYNELYEQVAGLAHSLRAMGIKAGDRIAGFMPNIPQTVIAMLAATSIGAIWSSCSPDFGIKGVLDRLGQIEPRVLFCANGYSYSGKKFDSLGRVAQIIEKLPTVEKVVVTPFTEARPDLSAIPQAVVWDDFVSSERGLTIEFEQVPASHPLYIMYSSGTTGLPKCMVQGVGGILVHHLKELVLHTDLSRDDVIFYFTTCGWMMWNWLVSSLATGSTVVLFDGAPFHPDGGFLWKVAQEEGITVFGTSAKYIDTLEKQGITPKDQFDLSALRTICSTGSPLSVENFEYVYREVKTDVQLASIAGGTDLNGCFALGNPLGPVYPGELQCRGLGMDVHAYNDRGESVVGQQGELVCRAPFPSAPLYFWNDPTGEKYHRAYFDVYPNTWRHGDFIEVTERGGVVFYGRSDATLNPGGVRIGTAEIYRQVEGLEAIADSVVVGQDWQGDVRVILFIKLADGCGFDDDLAARIKRLIRENASPRHVPAKIIPVEDIPYTINMKKVELAVRNVIHGLPVENKDALVNPQALDLYRDLPQLKS